MKGYLNRYERGKHLLELGYALSECLYARGLFFVDKPTGVRYAIDAMRGTCTCPATVADCAHIICLEAELRKLATRAVRRRITRRHMDGLRRASVGVAA